MFRYQAPDPSQLPTSVMGMRTVLSSKKIGAKVLPAMKRELPVESNEQLIAFYDDYHVDLSFGTVHTHDGAILETVIIKPRLDAALENDYFIVSFNPNGSLFQDSLDELSYNAVQLSATVIGFNYRAVGRSVKPAVSLIDLAIDGIAEVQHLLDNGAKSQNIVLDGISLGGAVATLVASHFHQLNLPVYLWNDRSFSSLPKAAAGFVVPDNSKKLRMLCRLPIKKICEGVMNPTGWNALIEEFYHGIPKDFKGYAYVSKKSCNGLGDGIVSHVVSLHRCVKPLEKAAKIKTGHKVYALERYGVFRPGHNLPRKELHIKDSPDVTLQNLFENFVLGSRV